MLLFLVLYTQSKKVNRNFYPFEVELFSHGTYFRADATSNREISVPKNVGIHIYIYIYAKWFSTLCMR